MGYCHKCEHDCSEIDPCPCCRKKMKYPTISYIPERIYPTIPYTENPFHPYGPNKPKPRYWSDMGGSPDIGKPKHPSKKQ